MDSRPHLAPVNDEYFRLWILLRGSRTEAGIPVSEVVALYNAVGGPDSLEDMIHMVNLMESTFSEVESEQRKRESEKKRKKRRP